MQLFYYGFITWLTARDTHFFQWFLLRKLILFGDPTLYLSCVSGSSDVFCCHLPSPPPPPPRPNPLFILYKFLSVLICRYTPPRFFSATIVFFFVIFFSYFKVWNNDRYTGKLVAQYKEFFLFLNHLIVSCPPLMPHHPQIL